MHEAMGIPVTAVGLILSANRLVRLVTNSLSGYVIDRFGRRWPFIGSLLLGGMTTIAYGGVRGVWIFLLARLLWGTAWSFLRIEGLSTAQLKRRRPRPGDTWHLDEVFVTINGQRHYLWRGEPSIRTTISSIS
jgi:MFS family permease